MVAVALVVALVVSAAGLAGWAAWAFFRDTGGDGGSATAPPPAPSATAAPPSFPPELARFYEQNLDWRACGENQCTRLTVPARLRRTQTGRPSSSAVLRVPATDRGQRVGQLVVNPGGPGGSGVDYAAAGAACVRQAAHAATTTSSASTRAESARARRWSAGDTKQTDEFLSADPDPDTPAEVATLDRLTREFGEGCLTMSGDLTRHISTVEAAKDMDILRAALGERQLDYFGASYGTFLGATYADLFPTHVRRMVLDGAIDPAAVLRAAHARSGRRLRDGPERRTSRTASGEANCVARRHASPKASRQDPAAARPDRREAAADARAVAR